MAWISPLDEMKTPPPLLFFQIRKSLNVIAHNNDDEEESQMFRRFRWGRIKHSYSAKKALMS